MRVVEGASAAAVVAVLVAVIAWRTGGDVVTVPAVAALATFVAVVLRARPAGSIGRTAVRRRRR